SRLRIARHDSSRSHRIRRRAAQAAVGGRARQQHEGRIGGRRSAILAAPSLLQLPARETMTNLERFADFNTAYQGMLYPMDTDHMGHANVRYYSRAFNEAAYFTFTTAGVTPDFMRATGRGMAAVEEHFLYRREILPGEFVV